MIPKAEDALRRAGLEPVWLHDNSIAVSSVYEAADVGKTLLAKMSAGDMVVDMTTGWNWPEHFGVVATMCQEQLRSGTLRLVLLCNMEEKAPGYVAARANALICEILGVPYASLTVLDKSDAGWDSLVDDLEAVDTGSYSPNVPSETVASSADHHRTAEQAIRNLRQSGGIVPIINPSSMTMAQGWPNYHMFKMLGLTPHAIGSNQFRADMDAVSLRDLLSSYEWLIDRGLQFEYTDGGLCEEEVFEALRMYMAKLQYFKMGAIGMGTQGQMDMTGFWPATDLSESMMMSTHSPGKNSPVVDVTESDCEALWTSLLMQEIIHVKYGVLAPIGFHDVRHYNTHEDTLVLLNSGALAFDFMCDSPEDLSDVHAVSQNRQVYFLNGGAAVKGNMRPRAGTNMFRAHGRGSGYRMQATGMNILPLSWEHRDEKYGKLDPWPMGIVQTPNGTTKDVTLSWVPNHSQHCEQDIIPEMLAACKILEVDFHCYAR